MVCSGILYLASNGGAPPTDTMSPVPPSAPSRARGRAAPCRRRTTRVASLLEGRRQAGASFLRMGCAARAGR